MRAEARARLLEGLAKASLWLDGLYGRDCPAAAPFSEKRNTTALKNDEAGRTAHSEAFSERYYGRFERTRARGLLC